MKKDIFEFDFSETKITKHAILCLIDKSSDKHEIVKKHWDKAKDLNDFCSSILKDDRLKMTYGYANLSRNLSDHWYRVREIFGDKCFKTESDAGSVKIGTAEMNILIPNGIGDGTTRIAVFDEPNEINTSMLNYTGVLINGNINIYSYDCGNNIAKTINGKFFIYNYEGLVAFVKC